MKLATKSLLAAIAVGALALMAAPEAKATATLRIYDTASGATATITDIIADAQATSGFADANAAPGAVTYVSVGQFAGWMFTVTTGANVQTQALPKLTLSISMSYTGSSPSTLTFEFSDTSFTGPPSGIYNSIFTSTVNNATATYSTYRDTNNNLFADGTDADGFKNINGTGNAAGDAIAGHGNEDIAAMTSATYSAPVVADTQYSGNFNFTGNYSLTQKLVITANQGASGSYDLTLSTPDGGTTAVLLGSAFIGLALLRRKLLAA
jgi:hypothetical protein